MKKIMMLTAAVFAFQTLPVLAADGKAPEGKKHERGMKMFDEQDTDKDGVVSEDEFVASMKKRFSEADANGDKKVTREEAKTHFESKRAEWKAKREAMKKAKQDKAADKDAAAAE